jgi:hypothetical protein
VLSSSRERSAVRSHRRSNATASGDSGVSSSPDRQSRACSSSIAAYSSQSSISHASAWALSLLLTPRRRRVGVVFNAASDMVSVPCQGSGAEGTAIPFVPTLPRAFGPSWVDCLRTLRVTDPARRSAIVRKSELGYDSSALVTAQACHNEVTMLPVQSKMARAAVGWGVREVAAAARVSPDTVARFERGETLNHRTLAAIREAFEAAGVEFIEQNGGGAGVRLRKPNAV